MPTRSIPFILAIALFSSAAAPSQVQAQSTLPATAPTNVSSPVTATSTSLTPGLKPHRAQVTFSDGKLQIRADNSSLNLILREIARQTGMTITGGVADERVFGNYGPAAPGTILATLLNGTGSNLLLQSDADNVPMKLILTPRTGGATPPNPNAPSFDDEERNTDEAQAPPPQPAAQTQQQPNNGQQSPSPNNTSPNTVPAVPAVQQPGASGPVSMPQPLNNVNGSENNITPSASTYPTTNSVPLDALPTPSTTPSSTGIVDSANPPQPGSTTPIDATQDSSSPKAAAAPTAEDYAKQLQALMASKAAAAKSGTATPPAAPVQTTTPQQ